MRKIIEQGCEKQKQLSEAQRIGLQCRIAREEVGLNQKAFAKKIGINPVSLSRIEKGKVKPSLETLRTIATATGKPMGFFFGEEHRGMNYQTEIDNLKRDIILLREELKKYGHG